MEQFGQKLCAWSGLASIILFFLGFWVIAGFIPPSPPTWNATQIAEMFAERRTEIRIGMLICMFAATLIGPWVSVISVQMRRAEGRHSALAYTQLILGGILVLEFIYLIMFWQTAAYRADRAPELIQLLNDMSWIPFVGITSTATAEAFAMGLVILGDKGTNPVFPRWAGYFNLLMGTSFLPGALNPFFQTGPFAWNGIFAWYIPLIGFGIWMVVMSVLLVQAVSRQYRDPETPSTVHGSVDGADLGREVSALREQISRMSAELAQLSTTARRGD